MYTVLHIHFNKYVCRHDVILTPLLTTSTRAATVCFSVVYKISVYKIRCSLQFNVQYFCQCWKEIIPVDLTLAVGL